MSKPLRKGEAASLHGARYSRGARSGSRVHRMVHAGARAGTRGLIDVGAAGWIVYNVCAFSFSCFTRS